MREPDAFTKQRPAAAGVLAFGPGPALHLVWLVALALAPIRTVSQDFTLITLDPGHFHAALFQREMLPGIAEEAFVFAPLGPDLTAHLNRVAQFNRRPDHPTHWRLSVYAAPDFEAALLRHPPGQIVVMSGRNRGKIDRIQACVRAGLHVLADKPWIIEPRDLSKLEATLASARAKPVTVYDAMTQRFEITAILQRALVNDAEIFGGPLTGSTNKPAVSLTSLHYLLKEVSGVPNLRPPWFFDIAEQGEGLTDVGTHLADMVSWVLFPEQPIEYKRAIEVLRARRWPTSLSLADFRRVTGENDFPAALQAGLKNGNLDYFCNNTVDYTLRGVHVHLEATWDYAPPPGRQDTESAVFCGSKTRIEVRQGPDERYRRELYVSPNPGTDSATVRAALTRRIAALQTEWPGLGLAEERGRFRLVIPDAFRTSHEEHFALVAQRFLQYARNPQALPEWEKANMLSKYYVTTRGIELARQSHP